VGLSFKDFLHLCATFASEPLVIILDQFEEFFQYQRYTDAFTLFIEQLAEAIRDRETAVTFLISMREDFALNLNAFKGYLPTILFENYYRLEKLDLRAAEEAIKNPIEKIGFHYEPGLLQTLLKDLADQERENWISRQREPISDEAPAFVEPPNVQIVCTKLWELEKGNPDKVIRVETYQKQGGSKGFINSYFESVITAFSPLEKKLASKAFDHLVTPRGTKMAYPVKDLSEKLRVKEEELQPVLVKLEKARVLRSQPRKEEIWYELYHDIFSGIIQQWNTRYKERQRNKRLAIGAGLAALTLLCLLVAYDVVINLTNHHLRVSLKTDQAGRYLAEQIEVYCGKTQSWDLFGLQHYVAEADYGHQELEPDKLFSDIKPVAAYHDLNVELIGQLPIADRIQAYWQDGKIARALELADKSINPNDVTRSQAVISILASFPAPQAFAILQNHVQKPSDGEAIRASITQTLGSSRFPGVVGCLRPLLQDPLIAVRRNAVGALGQIQSERAVELLGQALQDQEAWVRENAAEALARLRVPPILYSQFQKQPREPTILSEAQLETLREEAKQAGVTRRQEIAEQLGKSLSPAGNEILLTMLDDPNLSVHRAVVTAIAEIAAPESLDVLKGIALNPAERFAIRLSAIEGLGNIGTEAAAAALLDILANAGEAYVFRTVQALGCTRSKHALPKL
jgi:HEAT repeat protein